MPSITEVVHVDPGNVEPVPPAFGNREPRAEGCAIVPTDRIHDFGRDAPVGGRKALNRLADLRGQVFRTPGYLVLTVGFGKIGQIGMSL